MSEHHYKFNVTMTCGGCSGAVERVLKKLDGKSITQHPTNILLLYFRTR
jgi:copper chaperone CopZ